MMAQQLNGGKGRQPAPPPVCELVELRGLVFALDALADQIEAATPVPTRRRAWWMEVVPVTAPNAWQIQQIMAIAHATLARMEQDGTLDNDEAAVLAALHARCPRSMGCWCVAAVGHGRGADNEEAISRRVDALQVREARFAHKTENYRAATTPFSTRSARPKWRHAEFSVSVSAARPGVVITDEAALPDQAWRVERKIDKTCCGWELPEADARSCRRGTRQRHSYNDSEDEMSEATKITASARWRKTNAALLEKMVAQAVHRSAAGAADGAAQHG